MSISNKDLILGMLTDGLKYEASDLLEYSADKVEIWCQTTETDVMQSIAKLVQLKVLFTVSYERGLIENLEYLLSRDDFDISIASYSQIIAIGMMSSRMRSLVQKHISRKNPAFLVAKEIISKKVMNINIDWSRIDASCVYDLINALISEGFREVLLDLSRQQNLISTLNAEQCISLIKKDNILEPAIFRHLGDLPLSDEQLKKCFESVTGYRPSIMTHSLIFSLLANQSDYIFSVNPISFLTFVGHNINTLSSSILFCDFLDSLNLRHLFAAPDTDTLLEALIMHSFFSDRIDETSPFTYFYHFPFVKLIMSRPVTEKFPKLLSSLYKMPTVSYFKSMSIKSISSKNSIYVMARNDAYVDSDYSDSDDGNTFESHNGKICKEPMENWLHKTPMDFLGDLVVALLKDTSRSHFVDLDKIPQEVAISVFNKVPLSRTQAMHIYDKFKCDALVSWYANPENVKFLPHIFVLKYIPTHNIPKYLRTIKINEADVDFLANINKITHIMKDIIEIEGICDNVKKYETFNIFFQYALNHNENNIYGDVIFRLVRSILTSKQPIKESLQVSILGRVPITNDAVWTFMLNNIDQFSYAVQKKLSDVLGFDCTTKPPLYTDATFLSCCRSKDFNIDPQVLKDISFRTLNLALLEATRFSNTTLISTLLQHGADVNYFNSDTLMTPLMTAITSSSDDTFDFLLSHGAKVSFFGTNHTLIFAIYSSKTNEYKMKSLLSKTDFSDVEKFNNVRTELQKSRFNSLLPFAIDCGAPIFVPIQSDVSKYISENKRMSDTFKHMGHGDQNYSTMQDSELVYYLTTSFSIQKDALEESLRRPLNFVQYYKIFTHMNTKRKNAESTQIGLVDAHRLNTLQKIAYSISTGKDLMTEEYEKNAFPFTDDMFYYAILSNRSTSIVQKLIDFGQDVNRPEYKPSLTSTAHLCIVHNYIDMFALLIKNGLDVNRIKKITLRGEKPQYMTLINEAILFKRKEIIDLLISAKADLSIRVQFSPLQLTMMKDPTLTNVIKPHVNISKEIATCTTDYVTVLQNMDGSKQPTNKKELKKVKVTTYNYKSNWPKGFMI